MAVTSDKSAPYAPASVILDLIERHRARGLPTPINIETLERAGVAESLSSRTLQALQVLDLINENGEPTQTFEGIRKAPEGEYKNRIAEWLNGAYADVIKFVDPTKDNETAVRDAFRNYIPVGQQPRMVSLFLALYAHAGMRPEKSSQPRPKTNGQPRQRSIIKPSVGKAGPIKTAPERVHAGLPTPLSGLLAKLPPEGRGWTQANRDKFVTTFSAVLDFCYPVLTEAEIEDQEVE